MIKTIFEKYDRKATRILEILPGSISWTLILFPFIGAFFVPHYVAYFIIAFDLYWLYKSTSLAITAKVSHSKIKKSQNFNWLSRAKKLPNFKNIHHLVIVPTFKEPLVTIEKGLESVANQDFPKKQISVVLATEAREEEAPAKAAFLSQKFGSTFSNFLVTVHEDVEGEVKGKSSNQAYAAKIAKAKLVDEAGVDIDLTTVTSKDADAVLDPKYLSYLTCKFLENPSRHLRFWQPALVFYNNIWKVPAPIRVVNTFCTVWDIALLSRTDRLINFSVYSTSLTLLDQVGYWDADVIPEDYRIFFKSFFANSGKVEVDPIFLTVSADCAQSTTWWKTMVNQYEQMKRWAWGTSDDAYIIKKWLTTPTTSFVNKTIRVAHVLSDHFLWPVYWFSLTLGANVPILLNPVFAETVAGRNLPKVSFGILSLCWIALVVILYVDFTSRPKKPAPWKIFEKILAPAEFILMPVVGFFFSALPGIEAHTRLMLGKNIEYRVTEKV